MGPLETFAALLLFASLRYVPAVAIPAMSPMAWAPPMVRTVLVLALAFLSVMAMPATEAPEHWADPLGLMLACLAEILIGLTFGLAIVLPQAALGLVARLADTQAGLSAAVLFNPGGAHEPESMLGSIVLLAATVLFFTLDLHLALLALLHASLAAMPLGALALHLDLDAFLAMLGAAFLLGIAVLAPVVLGLFIVDVGVAYATRSMPQANVYFLALPLKVAVALLLLALTLAYAPGLVGQLFLDAFSRIPSVFGA